MRILNHQVLDQFFQQKHSKEQTQTVDGDNDFDEEFFVEKIRKYPCIWDAKCGGYKEQNAWSQLR